VDERKNSRRHPSITQVLRFFNYHHLPAELQEVSKPFHDLAYQVADRAPQNPETTIALRKLLESKDSAVRAGL